jgi:Holliday junction resolvase
LGRWAKQDHNAVEIAAVLRNAGAIVRFIEGSHGQAGIPDLLVGFRGVTYLLEVKVAKGRLSKVQEEFHASWRGGPIVVVRSPLEALGAIGLFEVAA